MTTSNHNNIGIVIIIHKAMQIIAIINYIVNNFFK